MAASPHRHWVPAKASLAKRHGPVTPSVATIPVPSKPSFEVSTPSFLRALRMGRLGEPELTPDAENIRRRIAAPCELRDQEVTGLVQRRTLLAARECEQGSPIVLGLSEEPQTRSLDAWLVFLLGQRMGSTSYKRDGISGPTLHLMCASSLRRPFSWSSGSRSSRSTCARLGRPSVVERGSAGSWPRRS
jgi:hypothetical protein